MTKMYMMAFFERRYVRENGERKLGDWKRTSEISAYQSETSRMIAFTHDHHEDFRDKLNAEELASLNAKNVAPVVFTDFRRSPTAAMAVGFWEAEVDLPAPAI